jgi:VWFA-related protein
MHRPLAACAALFLAGGAAAQQPTFRTSTHLIEVSVVVEDGSGRPAEGLSRDDFTLYEDDKEQPIALFAPPLAGAAAPIAVSNTDLRDATAAPGRPLTRGDFSNRSDTAKASVTVIVIDRLNTRFEDQRHVRDDVLKALGQTRRDDRVALYVLESDVVRVLHDFTTDTASLSRALSRCAARSNRPRSASARTSSP